MDKALIVGCCSLETYGWEEILEALRRDQGKVHEAKDPGKGILDGLLDTIPGAADALVPASVGAEHAVLCHLALLLAEEPRIVRVVGQDEHGDQGDDDGGDSLNEEEPLPRVQPGDSAHGGQDAGREETRDDVGDGVAGVPDGHARGVLVLGVPRRSHCFFFADKAIRNCDQATSTRRLLLNSLWGGLLTQSDTGKERGFSQSGEEADGGKTRTTVKGLLVRVQERRSFFSTFESSNLLGQGRGANRAHTPGQHDAGQEKPRAGLGQPQVSRKLTK